MNPLNNRLESYSHIAHTLSSLSGQHISELIETIKLKQSNIGGQSGLLKVGKHTVFVKKIPLTDLEKQPNNLFSTVNLFKLPFAYQYGIGSTGFGVWRELETHKLTTHWVMSGKCSHFPLLYHWNRLTSSSAKRVSEEQIEKLESDILYWEHPKAIRNRLEAIAYASEYMVLFLEFSPYTLTDRESFYVSDFGLALHKGFKLSPDEIGFFNHHLSYDHCNALVNLLDSISTTFFGKENWPLNLQEYIRNDQQILSSSTIDALIKAYTPVSLVMDEFYRNIQRDKSTLYPAKRLEQEYASISIEHLKNKS